MFTDTVNNQETIKPSMERYESIDCTPCWLGRLRDDFIRDVARILDQQLSNAYTIQDYKNMVGG